MITLAFGIEPRETLPRHNIALEVADLPFVQELFAYSVLATNIGTRARHPYEFFTIECSEKISGLPFKTVAFGFTRTGHI